MKTLKRSFAFILALLLALAVFPSSAFAAGRVDTTKEASLTVTLEYGTPAEPLPGAVFRAYRIGDVKGAGDFSLVLPYSGYGVPVAALEGAQWDNAAKLLAAQIAANELIDEYDAIATTDENGVAAFGEVEQGLYLVIGDILVDGSTTYMFNPAIVSVPTLDAKDNWVYDVEMFPKVDAGDEPPYSGFTWTERSVMKIWDAPKGTETPESVTVQLIANNEPYGDPVTLSKDNNWGYTWDKIPEEDQYGRQITWYISETPVTGYETNITQEGVTFKVKNTLTEVPKTELTVNKSWVGVPKDVDLPEYIEVTLYENDEPVETKKLTAKDGWTYTWANLDVSDEDGNTIDWDVTEEALEGYSTTYSQLDKVITVTNTYILPTTTTKTVEKKWEKVPNDVKLPDFVEVNLLADGEVYNTQKLTAPGWTYTWNELPIRINGKEVEWSIEEVKLEGYKTKITSVGDVFTITNTYDVPPTPPEPKYTEIEVEKKWKDVPENVALPEYVEVQLLADGKEYDAQKLSAKNNWTYKWEKLPAETEDGKLIRWTIKEISVDGYTTAVSQNGNKFTITNTYVKPCTTKVEVIKTWCAPCGTKTPDSVEVKLLKNGQVYDTQSISYKTGWRYVWDDLPVLDENGRMIIWSVEEIPVDGYKTTYAHVGRIFFITNTFIVPPAPITTEVEVIKNWTCVPAGVKTPESVEVELLKNGEVYDTQKLSASNNWNYKWTDLPMYENGRLITWTVSETEVKDYTTCICHIGNLFIITNKYNVPPQPPEPKTTEIEVVKEWKNVPKGTALPEFVEVQLLADGEVYDTQKLTAKNGWTYKWEKLPAEKNGKFIRWTIDEVAVNGYKTTISQKCNKFVITNTFIVTPEPCTTEVEVVKKWKDVPENVEIPASVEVKLLKNGEVYDTQELSEDGNWAYYWTELPMYDEDGKLIRWTVAETEVEDYTTCICNFGKQFIITNKYNVPPQPPEPKVTEIEAYKQWIIPAEVEMPAFVEVNLLANGEVYDTQKLSEGNNWNYKWEKLPVETEDGEIIEWTVKEVSIENFTSELRQVENKFYIKNTYKEPEPPVIPTTDITAVKKWASVPEDVVLPETIEVNLLADGEIFDTVQLNGETGWAYKWEDLPAETADGEVIEWTIEEVEVEGYKTTITQEGTEFTIWNTYVAPEPPEKPETIDITAEKQWKDIPKDVKTPESVEVKLYANGKLYDTQKLSAKNEWKFTWSELPTQNEDGKTIAWTIDETAVEGYKTKIALKGKTFVVTNTYITPEDPNPPLPYTGQLWWPIPILACLGLICLIIGFARRRRYE